MTVGIPKEIKSDENRVALLPYGAEILVSDGHAVLVETGSGEASGATDDAYRAAGAEVVADGASVFERADVILKVKEPVPDEYDLLRSAQTVFCYFHFAADEELTRRVVDSGIVAVAYETVRKSDGELPLLVPMSEVAGRMAVQEGAKYLESPQGGRGILLSGVPGVAPADVVILGGGVVGANAARIAAGLGAAVFILDIDLKRMRYLSDVMPANVTTLMSNSYNLNKLVASCDLLVGSVLIPGAKAPRLVTREMVSEMKEGAVIVDVSIDQGGCVETSRPTTHGEPIYTVDGVSHYCVTNIPGAVPRTSTFALTNATFPYIRLLAASGWRKASRERSDLAQGLNIVEGQVVHEAVAEAWELPLVPVDSVLN